MLNIRNRLIDTRTDIECISEKYELLVDNNSVGFEDGINFVYKISADKNLDIRHFKENVYQRGYNLDKQLKRLEGLGAKIEFYKIESEVLFKNLLLIDSDLPLIISNLLLQKYFKKESNLYWLIELLEKSNPLGYPTDSKHSFYSYKVKRMLKDMVLGMNCESVWNGKSVVSSIELVTREDGNVIKYYVYDIQKLITFLLRNTYLDNPLNSRGNFGKIYREKGQSYLKLNFQIRLSN